MSEIGERLYAHVVELFPLCRSITGDGLRATLHYIGSSIPLKIVEVPTDTQALDWTVPPEWVVREGYIRTLDHRTVVDFNTNNLHLVNYSAPFVGIVSRSELESHLHSLPDQPELIPYVTSYYRRDWGFCLPHRDRQLLNDDAYEVKVDTEFKNGSLSYGECVLPGELDYEVLISAHACHPSLANDNLSSIAIAIEMARILGTVKRKFTWRFLFAPGTIGAITWLAANKDAANRIRHGIVLTCLGDPAPLTYKCCRMPHAQINRYAIHVLKDEGAADRILPFSPTGYDERQFCSPGFNLPVGCLMRSPGGSFPEYHTSADNIDFVKPEALEGSLRVLTRIASLIEHDDTFRSTAPYGEPCLARHNLYDTGDRTALLWVLNLADGRHSLFDIVEQSGLPFDSVVNAAERLHNAGLLTRVAP